jgi:hypothetical protein
MSPLKYRLLPALAAAALTLVALGCPPPETKYSAAEKHTGPAVSKEAHPGADFNKFFPKKDAEYDVVFDQEKVGFASASLKKGLTKLADVSVSDAISTPDTVKEYDGVTDKLDGKYPLRQEGKKATAILVAGRYQVKIRNDADAEQQLTKEAREEWLKKFNLEGIAGLK